MNKRFLIASALAVLGFAGCASSPSRELLDARNAYARASAGPAARSAPADLHKARVSLDKAEVAFSSDSPDQRDLAYVAERKAQLAEVLAARADHAGIRVNAEATLASEKDASHQKTKEELERTKTNLVNAEQNASDQRERTAEANTRTADQKQLTADADARAAESDRHMKAMQLELAKWAAVKQEPRGMVITLSGSVLFASAKATLLPEARTRLGQVAAALMETKERRLAVEGYTDSQGTDAYNLDLSQRRADAVRVYLVSNGYPPDLVVAHGVGKAQPVADNATAEGRANNRRVEIVVSPAPPGVSSR
jgi:outer membrane protein OmpA-like peptidoglycan-associated protein